MPENLIDRFPATVDHQELLRAMHDHFGMAAFSKGGTIDFPATARAQIHVKVQRGAIREVHAAVGFDDGDFNELVAAVQRRLVDSPGPAIARTILHTSRSFNGYWRHETLPLQLLPAPPEAPRPPVIMADHAFLLESQIQESTDGFITNQRILRAGVEWGLVLNALLRVSIKVPDPRGWHLWVYDDEAGTSRWLQALYSVPSFDSRSSALSEPAGPEIPQFSHAEYYESWAPPLASEDRAGVPDSLGRLLRAFTDLDPERRGAYLRAARWIHTASNAWNLTASSWFTAMVSAIETLVPVSTERCPQCDSMVGVSRSFREFVEQYSAQSSPQMRRTIYNIRSKISHGSMLLPIDETPWAFGATFDAEQRQAMDDLHRIVRDIMVNWLFAN